MKIKYFVFSFFIHFLLILILTQLACPKNPHLNKIKLNITYQITKSKTVTSKYEEHQKKISKNNELHAEEISSISEKLPEKIFSEANIENKIHSNITNFNDELPLPSKTESKKRETVDYKIKKNNELPIPKAKKIGKSDLNDTQTMGDFFQIEGDLENRMILNKPAPESVTNLSEDIEIKFQMKVDDKGNVIEVLPIKKGHFLAEKNSIEALKKWKFNPLPKLEENSIQSGIITIYFKIN